MKKIKPSVLFLFGILLLTLTNCSDLKKEPLTEDQQVYAGRWVANDGTWIQIYNNGGGSFETSNTSVDGGKTTIADGEITIGLFGIKKTFSIDEPPFEEDGKMKMVLNGYQYEKATY